MACNYCKWLFVVAMFFTLSISSALAGGAAPRKLLAPTFPTNLPNVGFPALPLTPLLPPPTTSLPNFPPLRTFPIYPPPNIIHKINTHKQTT
ncbi:hypothetical protein D8674_038072 [Pyrus ussuriensis x Pyrus communis]|uniref:Uncharacterized protein n=1 Tax=Pyrus ussuriensis x Pyrus communis TaxID=2448454 RepID=A0A5N5I863_9ROSA|nr:hypothetical protein D8674_038179 [Pyrus ussuriensis x Pyrus communis]KAB2634874.1 hypothetical protein D8674_038072 [Pyrus ussuriensis x Pyrus communis]